jgi:hypothetical protein
MNNVPNPIEWKCGNCGTTKIPLFGLQDGTARCSYCLKVLGDPDRERIIREARPVLDNAWKKLNSQRSKLSEQQDQIEKEYEDRIERLELEDDDLLKKYQTLEKSLLRGIPHV